MSDAALADPPAPPAEPPATPPAEPPATPPPPAAPPATPPPQARTKPVAVAPVEPPAPEPEAYWKDDWRARIAGTDDKRNPKRKTLERFADPAAIFNSYEELRARWDAGGLVKLPGEKASTEELAAFHKALGVPEKPTEYLDHIKLDNGMVLGDADKPIVEYFATAAHKAGTPPAAFNAIVNAYYAREEQMAAELDKADDTFRTETKQFLKDELGPTFIRHMNATKALFMTAPGGANEEDETSLYARLLGGRTADGRIIGDDPDFLRWMVGMVREVAPLATVTEDANATGQNVDDEIAKIEKRMRDDRQGYFRDDAMQKRYVDLIAARNTHKARSAA